MSTQQLCYSQGNPNKALNVDKTRHTVDKKSYSLKEQNVFIYKKYCRKGIKRLKFFLEIRLCESVCSYLASLLLPEDSRLWISLGFTWEGSSAALRHNLIPWTDDKLGCSWSQRTKATALQVERHIARPNIGVRSYWGEELQAKTSNNTYSQIKIGVLYRASMQH